VIVMFCVFVFFGLVFSFLFFFFFFFFFSRELYFITHKFAAHNLSEFCVGVIAAQAAATAAFAFLAFDKGVDLQPAL